MIKKLTYHTIDRNGIITDSDLSVDIQMTVKEENIKVTLKALEDLYIDEFVLTEKYEYSKNDLIFANGFQSWTETKEYTVDDRLHDVLKCPSVLVNKYSFDRYGDNSFKKYRKNIIHGYDYSYIKGDNPLFIVSENCKNAYLIINHEVKNNRMVFESDIKGLFLKKGSTLVAFDFIIKHGDVEKSIDGILGHQHTEQPLIGYTSWYNHYENISEEIIGKNLDAIDKPFTLYQIDDGYESKVGDWLQIDKSKFPNGLRAICEEIKQKGLQAGIWLAPFVAEEESKLFKNKKDFFARDNEGNFIKCGSNWSGFYALDIYNEEVREYIKTCLRYYTEMGFSFFKLDFLYAPALCNPKDKTRASVIEDAYAFLKESLSGCEILGCGAVISNCAGKFKYVRVGPDVTLSYDDVWYMKYFHRERPSTKNTIQNTVYRSIFDKRLFYNDPDVFLLREDNIKLNEKQKQALAVVNALFGSVLLTSDAVTDYNEQKKDFLNYLIRINVEAKEKRYRKEKNKIRIEFTLDGKKTTYIFSIKKGEFVNG